MVVDILYIMGAFNTPIIFRAVRTKINCMSRRLWRQYTN